MPSEHRLRKHKLLAICATALVTAGTPVLTEAAASGAPAASNAILTIGREGNTVFSRNFNPFSPNADLGTTTAVYEPLVVYTPTNGRYTPWLASSWTWGPKATSLSFHLRHGVQWSDGQPFNAQDVVYTFHVLKRYFAGGGFPFVKSVTAVNAYTAKFAFTEPFAPALGLVGGQVIAPAHIWSKIANPVTYTNPNPVGTGPFTQVTSFTPEVYVLGRNPHYWQPGKPYFAGIRYPAYAGNPQAQAATASGEVDWADLYFPNVDKTYVAKDPKHFHYWFAQTGGTVTLVLNTTMAPFNNVVVRKAISMAINRQANVNSVYGPYTAVGNSTGLSPTSNYFDKAIAKADNWTSQNVVKANAMLNAAGYKKGPNGIRLMPDGKPMSFTLETGGTSTDYVQSAQNIAANVKKIGIDMVVTPKAWNNVISDVQLGHFQAAHMFGVLGTTPYTFYDFFMGCGNVVPVGQNATQNWARFCDKKATRLLADFAAATTPAAQHRIADSLQAEFAATAPVIPLFTQPDWGEFNTTRFTGWPSAADPYATGQSRYPGAVLVLTTVKPVA